MEVKPIQADWTKTQLSATNETLTQSLAARKQPYYRSKAFISRIGVNPLIAASAPLFFLVEKFQYHDAFSAPNLVKLREDILHEVRAFEQQAAGGQHHRPAILQVARYILCLWIDEMILNTRWGRESDWVEQKLADHLPAEGGKEKSFFLMLTQCMQDPIAHIELLELFYLCLSLGFEGEYRYLERGHILLAEIRDNLYHTIQMHRGEISKQLEIKTEQAHSIEKFTSRLWIHVLVSLAVTAVIVGGYFFMNQWLNSRLLATQNIFEQSTVSEEAKL